jgi:hypothetical protein
MVRYLQLLAVCLLVLPIAALRNPAIHDAAWLKPTISHLPALTLTNSAAHALLHARPPSILPGTQPSPIPLTGPAADPHTNHFTFFYMALLGRRLTENAIFYQEPLTDAARAAQQCSTQDGRDH